MSVWIPKQKKNSVRKLRPARARGRIKSEKKMSMNINTNKM